MWTPGPLELSLILGTVVLLFGGKKIPGLDKGLGKGIRDFRNAKKGIEAEDEKLIDK
jgi:sec-independent protein translocase protein TatA